MQDRIRTVRRERRCPDRSRDVKETPAPDRRFPYRLPALPHIPITLLSEPAERLPVTRPSRDACLLSSKRAPSLRRPSGFSFVEQSLDAKPRIEATKVYLCFRPKNLRRPCGSPSPAF